MGIHQLFIDFIKAYNSVRKETLYNILIESDIPMNLVRLIILLLFYFFAVALRPNAGHGLLIFEVSRSHTTTHHSR